MRTKKLHDLIKAYESCSENWNEWVKRTFCSFSQLEWYAMEIHISNVFEVVPEAGIMFYNKKDFAEVIKFKLLDHSQLLLYGAFLIETLTYRYVEDG